MQYWPVAAQPWAKKQQPFFTSGSKEADQRASQRMAKSEQLAGAGGGGEESVKEKGKEKSEPDSAKPEAKKSLFDRPGAEQGLTAIVEDFTPRALQDPRVNWDRKDVKGGGWFHHASSNAWNPTPDNVATLKKHMIQFLALATGGPADFKS